MLEAAPQLRALRQGSSPGCARRAHLQLRVHVLRRVRGGRAPRRVPELRRRLPAAPDPPGGRVARDDRARKRPGRHAPPPHALQPRRARPVRRRRCATSRPPSDRSTRSPLLPRPAPAPRAGSARASPRARRPTPRPDPERPLRAARERLRERPPCLSRWLKWLSETDDATATPIAPPICCAVLIRPEARPASCACTPASAAIETGMNANGSAKPTSR